MIERYEEIIAEIRSYIEKSGGTYKEWYVGISKNPVGRLLNDHRVKEKDDLWIYRQASSPDMARKIESYFINMFKTDGGTGGEDEEADWVYAYRKNSYTKP
jgi:hypothetical protein